jgi:thiosulfate/3-mercaptopyruvate sulfurtransferase
VAPLKPLVSTGWLAARTSDPGIRIVDCRFYSDAHDEGRSEYAAAHIPGAIYLSLEEDLTGTEGPGRHPLPPAREFQTKIERLGIGTDHTVVAYDNGDAAYAPRLWWMLRSLGHSATHVLDGGWRAWIAESNATTHTAPQFERASFEGHDDWTGVINQEAIVAAGDRLTLIDARAAERYAGIFEPFDPVAGHIEGAISIPYADNVADSGCFRSVDALQSRFESVLNEAKLVAYCGSGVTACSNLLALEILGRSDALLYPGSWSDWCA